MSFERGLLNEISKIFGNKLHTIDLSNCDILDCDVTSLVNTCGNLISIDVHGCNITDKSINSLAKKYNKLTSISLRLCKNITNKSIEYLLQYCKEIYSIHVDQCPGITDDSTVKLADEYKEQLLYISLGSDKITDASICSIVYNCTKLRTIFVLPYKITSNSINRLAELKVLRALDLYGIKLTDEFIIKIGSNCKQL